DSPWVESIGEYFKPQPPALSAAQARASCTATSSGKGLTTSPYLVTQASKARTSGIMVCQMTAGEDIAIRRKKLRYRAWHRGTREMDLVLGPYADTHTDSMDDSQLDRLEALISEEDPPLLTWVMGQETPP